MPSLLVTSACLVFAVLPGPVQKGGGKGPQGGGAKPPSQATVSDFQQEVGKLGTQYPQPNHVLVEDTPVHQDTKGGVDQRLLDLVSGPDGGFGAVWQDQRDGSLGLYMGLLDSEGVSRGPEVPVNPPLTARQFSPALALGLNARGAAAWFATSVGKQGVLLRFFDGAKGFSGVPIPVGQASGREVEGGTGAGQGRGSPATRAQEGVGHVPALVANPLGKSGAVAWLEAGEVWTRAFFDPRSAEEQALRLNPEGPLAKGEVHLAINAKGETLTLWRDEARGLHTVLRALPEPAKKSAPGQAQAAGEGEPLRLHADPSGGWWVLVRIKQGLVLRHLSASGLPDRKDLAHPAAQAPNLPRRADFSPYLESGVALCLERAENADEPTAARIEVYFLKADGTALLADPLVVLRGVQAIADTRIVSHGDALCVAWTDERNGNADVYVKTYSPSALDRQELRWNTDEASSSQTNPDIDSYEGNSAVVVWQDERDSSSRPAIWGRVVSKTGAFAGNEFTLSPSAAGACWFPAVAQAQDGRFCATWSEEREGGFALQACTFDPAGQPLGAALDLEAAGKVVHGWGSALVALPERHGYAVIWIRKDVGPLVQRIGMTGKLEGSALQIGAARSIQGRNPSVCLLDDGRLFAAWDLKAERGKTRVVGRFLGADLKPLAEELDFEGSPNGGDWDPVVCPSREDGFVLAWCGNDGPARDVFARRFDKQGKPAGPPLAISVKNNEQDFADLVRLADKSVAIAWEDDISWRDHVQLRRIAVDGRAMGAPMTLNQRPSLYVDDRTAPRLARLGDGLAGVWDDRRRSKGHDVYLRVLGPNFDSRLPDPLVVGPDKR